MAACSVRALLQTCVEALTTTSPTTTSTTVPSGEHNHTTTNTSTLTISTHHHQITRVKLLHQLLSRGLGFLLSLPSPWSSSARADTVQAVIAVAQALHCSRLPGPQPTLRPPGSSSSGGGSSSSSSGSSRGYTSLPLAISTSMHERFLNSSSRRTPGRR